MMDFRTLLAEILAAETLPETAHDDLIAAYELDLSVPTAAVDAKSARIAELESEVTALKLRVHDLIEYGNSADKVGDDSEPDDAPAPDAEDLAIEDIFDPNHDKDN